MPSFTWRTVDTTGSGPGPRSRHGLVYDRHAGAAVLFGGIVWNQGGWVKSDTWELKNGYWSEVEVVKRPPARHRGGMVFDEHHGVTVLFGGQGNTGMMLGATWLYADHQWKKQKSRWWSSPAPRCGHALAYDAESRCTVLFGGIAFGDRTLGDTWILHGTTWKQLNLPHPPARRYAAFAYDPDAKGCVLHGGSVDDAGKKQFGDAWLFRDRRWLKLPPAFETDVRDDHGFAYHHSARTMVMLDGTRGRRGVLFRASTGWEFADCSPLHPRHQCSPLAWDDSLNGLLLYGGESHHAGPQFHETLMLQSNQYGP